MSAEVAELKVKVLAEEVKCLAERIGSPLGVWVVPLDRVLALRGRIVALADAVAALPAEAELPVALLEFVFVSLELPGVAEVLNTKEALKALRLLRDRCPREEVDAELARRVCATVAAYVDGMWQ